MNRILTQKEWEQSVAETFSAVVESTYKSMIDEAVQREREACAKVCERMARRTDDIRSAALEMAAENIRARGKE